MSRSVAVIVTMLSLCLLAVLITFSLAVADLRGDATARQLWIWAGRIWTALCGAIPLALLALIGGGTYIILRNGAVYARTHAPLIYHQRGLLPAVADVGVRIVADHCRNERAEIAQAIFDGNVDRANVGGIKALLNPKPEEEVLAPSAPELPERVEIFSAPILDRPALLLGQGQHGPVILELDEGGHVLVGGSPRTGKTNLLASFIVQAARQSPRGEIIQIALCDLKRVDFALLPADLQLLRWPVATSVEEALALVRAVEAEMDRRLALLEAAHMRTIGDYNRYSTDRLPYLLQIIDEIGELSAHPSKDVRDVFAASVQRVGQLGSAVGVMQVLATQRPSAKVITRSVTGICDTRVALKVATMIESQLILDAPGAESLPPVRGRALIRIGGEIVEVQTHYAGLRDGRFDRLLNDLPRRPQLPPDSETSLADIHNGGDFAGVPFSVPQAVPTAVQAKGWSSMSFTPPVVSIPQVEPPSVPHAVTPSVPLTPSGKHIVPDGKPSEELMRLIYATWRGTYDPRTGEYNLSQTQRKVFGYDGGRAYQVTAYSVNEMLRRRGRSPIYKQREL